MARLRSVPWVSVLLGLATGVALGLGISVLLNTQDLAVRVDHNQIRSARNQRITEDNQRVDTQALCALRSDLQTRATQGRDFLRSHPHGALGFSKATISATLDGQERSIRALSPIRCPTPPHSKKRTRTRSPRAGDSRR